MEANNSQHQDSKQIPSERNKNKFFTWIYHKLRNPNIRRKIISAKSRGERKQNPFKEQQQDWSNYSITQMNKKIWPEHNIQRENNYLPRILLPLTSFSGKMTIKIAQIQNLTVTK